jgi:hypothetical protein
MTRCKETTSGGELCPNSLKSNQCSRPSSNNCHPVHIEVITMNREPSIRQIFQTLQVIEAKSKRTSGRIRRRYEGNHSRTSSFRFTTWWNPCSFVPTPAQKIIGGAYELQIKDTRVHGSFYRSPASRHRLHPLSDCCSTGQAGRVGCASVA